VLVEYCARHAADNGGQLRLLSRSQFAEWLLWKIGYDARALIVGLNLPFDLSRLAIGWQRSRSQRSKRTRATSPRPAKSALKVATPSAKPYVQALTPFLQALDSDSYGQSALSRSMPSEENGSPGQQGGWRIEPLERRLERWKMRYVKSLAVPAQRVGITTKVDGMPIESPGYEGCEDAQHASGNGHQAERKEQRWRPFREALRPWRYEKEPTPRRAS